MADEQIKVEHIVNNTQVIKALEKMIKRIEASEKAAAKSGQTSQKAAKAAAGSFAELEAKLKENEKHLKNLALGSKEFTKQQVKVQNLREKVDELKSSFIATKTSVKQTNREMTQGPKAAAGSFAALEEKLKANEQQLKNLTLGSKEFTKQRARVQMLQGKVDNLRGSFKKTSTEVNTATGATNTFASTAISRLAQVAVGAGVVTLGVRKLREAIEAVEEGNEGKRLSTVDFQTGLISGKGNFAALPQDQDRLRGVSLNLAKEHGLNPGGVAQALGELKSVGAANLDEAATLLSEGAKLNPGNLGDALALARTTSIEVRGTGNRNVQEVMGGILSAQIASQTVNPVEFGKAFSANTVALFQSGGFGEEEAREEAAIFSAIEPKSADVAATSEKAFERAVRKFEKLDGKGTFRDKIKILEQDADLRAEFIEGLPDEGRNAIVRRINPTKEDQATFAQIRKDVVSGPEAAARLRKQQEAVAVDGAAIIAQSRREAGEKVSQIEASAESVFSAELKKSRDAVAKLAADDSRGAAVGGMLADASLFAAGFLGGDTADMNRVGQLYHIAKGDPQVEDRNYAKEQLQELQKLAEATDLKEQSFVLRMILRSLENGIKINAPPDPARERPVPAEAIP